jgi:mxaA protein
VAPTEDALAITMPIASASTTSDASASTTPDASAATTTPPPRAIAAAAVEQPRLTGYFVGDLLTQRVLLERDGQTVTPVALPTSGRVSAWFERRGAKVITDAALRHWLAVEYQILNAPPKLTDVTLPAWQLAVTSGAGGSIVALQIPAISINVAPLSPPGSPEQVGTRDLRRDRVPPVIPIAPIRRAIALSSGALALTLIGWITWVVWRNRRAVATQPFARALREMKTLDDREPRAWQALHRAFDRTAGRVIQSATLPTLFERAPQLTPARAQIEAFFAQSSLLFFGSATANGDAAAQKEAPVLADLALGSAGTSSPTAESRSATSRSDARSELSRSNSPRPTASGAAPSFPRALCVELRRIEQRHEP